jgi:hypothetical protein
VTAPSDAGNRPAAASQYSCNSAPVIDSFFLDLYRPIECSDALEMANGLRQPGEGLIAHTDRGSQGGFNWSSQHLVMEVVGDGCSAASAGGSRDAWTDVVAGPSVDCAA